MSPAAVTLPFLGEVVALLVVSVLIAYLCYRLRRVPIAGFLLAGVLIGPGALGLVEDLELVQATAEIGVVLLLFTIGVEFSLTKLARLGRAIFVGGGLQVGITTALVVAALALFGVSVSVAVFTGFLAALSSTAIVLTLLAQRAETDTPAGQLTLAVLIFQDLAVVVMVLLVPILAGEGGGAAGIAWALAKAAFVVAAVLVGARRLVPWVLERVAHTRRPELFLLTVVAVCLGTAWATSLAGVSIALGAFLAGLVVSESDYADYALSEILPLQTVFNAVFFVSVGMLLDPAFLLAHLPLVLGVAAGVIVVKAAVTAGAVRVLGYPMRIAAVVGLGLAQIGEFSFVLAIEGARVGLSPGGLGTPGEQGFIAVTVVLMLLTPLQVAWAPKLGRWVARNEPAPPEPEPGAEVALEDHVVVVGYGPAGRRLVRVLQNTGLPFVVVELNPTSVEEAREEGIEAVFGDATRPHILERAGIHRAKLGVFALNDRDATFGAVRLAHYLNPTLQIIARTRFIADVEALHEAGADVVVPEELETAV
ncbi:MAG: cation:proton antiporter, partial [Rhodothermales bacterium]|nr:cation:proton antiporter [Rhodothermales bacterium]